MSETNATVFPPGRYGRRREPARRQWPHRLMAAVIILSVVAVGSVSAYSLAERYGPGRPYEASVLRFYDVTDDQVVVEFQVVVPDGDAAICAVRARARHGGEVGRDEIRVDPPPGETRPVVIHRLTTRERPITGEVQRCWPAQDH